jgi:hypothetical protein
LRRSFTIGSNRNLRVWDADLDDVAARVLPCPIMDRKPTTLGVRPPDALRQAVVRLEHERGSTAAARELGISRESLARIVAGLGVRAGTIALVRERLAPKKGRRQTAAA